MAKNLAGRSLTIYLLSADFTDPLDVVSLDSNLDFDTFETEAGDNWLLFVRNVNSGKPGWVTYLHQLFGNAKFSNNSSVSALLLVPSSGRLWAITFGRGRFILREGVIEERFGLRCALNAVDPDKVRAIDKETFDSFAAQARQQATAETEFSNFGVDVDRDLLYAVTGKPQDESWATVLLERTHSVHQREFQLMSYRVTCPCFMLSTRVRPIKKNFGGWTTSTRFAIREVGEISTTSSLLGFAIEI